MDAWLGIDDRGVKPLKTDAPMKVSDKVLIKRRKPATELK
jgi:hypothetical protein